MTTKSVDALDEIDRHLIRILSKDPRASYVELSEELAARGHELTSEAVRRRVQDIMDVTSVFFMLSPDEHGWEIIRIGIHVANEPDAIQHVFEQVKETGTWLVCTGIGSYDVWAIGTSGANEDIQKLLAQIRGIEFVDGVEYFIETSRSTSIEKYLNFEG